MVCGEVKGRFGHSQLPAATVDPIFLDKTHPLTGLIVKDCHGRVMHSGVRSTLTELRSEYWLVQARQLIKVLSAEIYFHKPITLHLELYLFYHFIHFLLYIGQY